MREIGLTFAYDIGGGPAKVARDIGRERIGSGSRPGGQDGAIPVLREQETLTLVSTPGSPVGPTPSIPVHRRHSPDRRRTPSNAGYHRRQFQRHSNPVQPSQGKVPPMSARPAAAAARQGSDHRCQRIHRPALAARLRELGTAVRGVDLVAAPADDVVAGGTVNPPVGRPIRGVDVVIHHTALVSNAAPLDKAWEVNVLGTHRVLRAPPLGVPRFVHISSIAARTASTFPTVSGERSGPGQRIQLRGHQSELRARRAGRPRRRRDRGHDHPPRRCLGAGLPPWTIIPWK